MPQWKNDEEMFALMKEKLYTPVVGDILDQMGYPHQFLPAQIKPLESLVSVEAFIARSEPDNRLKLAGYACTVLENDVFGEPKKPFGYLTEALDQLRPNEIYVATGAHNSALWAAHGNRQGPRRGRRRAGRLQPGYAAGAFSELPGLLPRNLGAGLLNPDICL